MNVPIRNTQLETMVSSSVLIALRNYSVECTLSFMGAWGYNSIQNDAGLNELGLLLEKSDLVEHIRASLNQDIHECPDEIRATAYLIYVLAKHDLWEHDSFGEIIPLAVSRLESILNEGVYTNANFVGEVIHLRNQLRDAGLRSQQAHDVPPCEP